MRIILLVVAGVLVTGCAAPRPVLAPSPRPPEAGDDQAQRDIQACMDVADRATPLSGAERAARESADMSGRMAGATRLPGGGVVEGPARQPSHAPSISPAWRAAVERCLAERGYAVLRWE